VITHPLMRDRPGSARATARGVDATCRLVDKLLIERALPVAVQRILEADTGSVHTKVPPFMTGDSGVPVYRSLDALASAGGLPTASMYAVIADTPPGSFVVQLDVETMENTKLANDRPFIKGSWHLFVPATEPIRKPMLVRRNDGEDFQASGTSVTFALVGASTQQDGVKRMRMSYASMRPNCRSEQINADMVELIGVFERVLGN
jgi:hypothetical protein